MRAPGYNVYVATTPEAVRAIYRNPKTMEFAEIQRIAMRRLFNYPEEAIDKLGIHLNGDGTLKLINKPGPELDEVNSKGETELAKLMRSFTADGSRVQLCGALRKLLTFAICAALWGSEYPMLHDPSLEEDLFCSLQHRMVEPDIQLKDLELSNCTPSPSVGAIHGVHLVTEVFYSSVQK